MHSRYIDHERYFQEQADSTEKYILPYIALDGVLSSLVVTEIGCGFGGGLKVLLDRGAKVYGIDISTDRIKLAQEFLKDHPHKSDLTLITKDIFEINPEDIPKADLIIMRDVIEHIHDHEKALRHIKSFFKPNGKLFVAFPPWRMPFGGHQQVCNSKILSKLPYLHLLPKCLYHTLLKFFKEPNSKIDELLELKETKMPIQKFIRLVKKIDFKIEKQTFYLINPNYEIKFGLKPKKLPFILNIPFIRDFYTTALYTLLFIHQ